MLCFQPKSDAQYMNFPYPSLNTILMCCCKVTTQTTSKHNRRDNMMDVTFVLEESGVSATVEVPCEANAAAAKEVACTALAVSPASVEMRIGTQVLEGTCRLQDTAFGAGVTVVLAACPRFADIKCPAEHSVEGGVRSTQLSLSRCGTLCVFYDHEFKKLVGLNTETFETAFECDVDLDVGRAPAISACKTRGYLLYDDCMRVVALPGGEVLHKVEDCWSVSVFACGGVVVQQDTDCVYVYDEDLTLLRSLSHERCENVAVSHCGGWVMTSTDYMYAYTYGGTPEARLWDVNTGKVVACVPTVGSGRVAISSASIFAVEGKRSVQLYDWSGAALGSFAMSVGAQGYIKSMQFTPCGKYLVVSTFVVRGSLDEERGTCQLHQYDVATMSHVRMIWRSRFSNDILFSFVISPCSSVVMFTSSADSSIMTRHLRPHNG